MNKREYYEALLKNPNVQKGLALIRYTEGTARYSNPYSTTFGGRQYDNMKGHPGTLYSFREKSGKRNKTSAHGAYQFLRGTWKEVAAPLGLKNMSPVNQDIAALARIDQRGGLQALERGNFDTFVTKVGREWASLPTAPNSYDQPKKSWARVNKFLNSYQPANSPALAYNEQSLPRPSRAPFPDTSSGLFQPANLFASPRGQVQRESLGPAKPSPLPSAPSGNVIRAGSLPKATPPTEVNPKARILQASYQKRNVPTPVARPTDIPKPTYTPKASDYSNYMMNVKQPTLPTGSAIPLPAARPAGLTPAPVIDGPVGKPLELVPTPPTRIQQAKTKATNHLKEQLHPKTLAARGAGALIGGLLLGPMGAKAGQMFGPQIAKQLNNRNSGLFGIFNNQQPDVYRSGQTMGSSSSEWGNANNQGATYNASDGASITGLGNGTYARTNPVTGGTSYWNEDGSRSTKGY